MKKSIKAIFIGISILLAVCISVKYVMWRMQMADMEKEMKSIQYQIEELRKEKVSLTNGKPYKVKTEHATSELDANKPKVIVCFRSVTEDAYEEIYPLMTSKGFSGTLVSLAGVLPGSNDRISIAHANELVDDNWGYAIGAGSAIALNGSMSANKANLQEYLEKYVKEYKDMVGRDPDAIYFSNGTYKKGYNPILLDLGFDLVFYEGKAVATDDKRMTVVHVQENPGSEAISRDFDNGQITGIKMEVQYDSYTAEDVRYSEDMLRSILDNLNLLIKDGECQKVDFSNIRDSGSEDSSDSKKESVSIEARIREIDERIRELYLESGEGEDTETEAGSDGETVTK